MKRQKYELGAEELLLECIIAMDFASTIAC